LAGKSSWDTTSGLIDEYEMTLEEVWFGKDPAYMEGKQACFMVRGVAELDGEVLDEEKTNYYSLGDGWDTPDGGDTAVHGAGKKQFNKNSSYGKFIDHVVALGDEVIAEVKSRGETTEAVTFQGLRFRFERKDFTFTDRKTHESREYSVELPVEFLGFEGEEEAPKPAPKTRGSRTKAAPAEEAPPAAEAPKSRRTRSKPAEEAAAPASGGRRTRTKAANKTESGTDPALRLEVLNFAAAWEEYSDFMETVLDPDEFARAADVQADEELLNDILDPNGSIWTESREIEPPE